ncbi:glycoside hydrolase domain-containing protein [Streptacidiphilus neutrinimicus]|uniref:glycoside hydrolase domain-containing protein n=1 Tax=Streptacidiphilus neutrinimicus TaxID=105420 RepID=UPI0006936EE7|nr:glycoside hydrolase domain-containing protein [Streptacidiphilus neutrinimicus]
MGATGIDIAWDRPSIAEIKATGATWVARYFSNDPTKNLTSTEVSDYRAAGLGLVTVWESTAGRALQGHGAGVSDANTAWSQRAGVGLPDTTVVYFAVDSDTDWASVEAYFQGVRSVLGSARTGVYGGLRVIQGAHAAGLRYLWQTVAWSGGVWASFATIRQPGGTALNGGADYDTAEAADFGQYPRPVAPPQPVPTPAPSYLEEEVLAYLPPLAPNTDADIPVEPAGTLTAPGGAARNGPLWLCLAAQGGDGTVAVSMRTAKGWSAPTQYPVTLAGGKVVLTLPTDGSVDVVRVTPTVPLLGYVTGRQVA